MFHIEGDQIMTTAPANFPDHIFIQPENYRNWSSTIVVDQMWTCTPKTAEDVVTICNWAKSQSPVWPVRAKGVAHGWSPLTIVEGTKPGANILLVDLSEHLKNLKFIPAEGTAPAMVKAEAGAKMLNLLTFLQFQQGGNGSAMGFTFPHVPAPGNLTVGGVLAINGHGTAVSTSNEHFSSSYGSVSNLITAFTAVVSSDTAPYDYELRMFDRGDPDAAALLVHAGRTIIVSATLQVIDNFNLRCQSMMDIPADTLFAAPTGATPPPQSLGSYLEASGRVEAIWYPFTDEPWLKVWTVEPTKPSGAKQVDQPYNYAFSDNLPIWVTTALKEVTTSSPELTPTFEKYFAMFTKAMLSLGGLSDLWGPSMNTLLYVRDTTLRVTANGYAIQMKRADVQHAVHDVVTQFQTMLEHYEAKGQYPVNAPLEIRVTGLDDPSEVYAPPGQTAQSPLISSLTYDAVAKANGYDCAVWFDVLTLPGTPYANDFYAELEAWFTLRFIAPTARLFPEWSKGWAYTNAGGWTDRNFFAEMRSEFSKGRAPADNWNAVTATYQKYDRANLYSNALLDELFVKI
ncbi:MAG: hypothetical protein ACI96W_003292 [Paraglaciecola sp.]